MPQEDNLSCATVSQGDMRKSDGCPVLHSQGDTRKSNGGM